MSENAHSPLHQFEVHPLFADSSFHVAGLDLSFTNASLWMVLSILAVIALLYPASRKRALVPGRLQASGEMLTEFLQETVTGITGKEGLKYFPFIFTLFIFILACNLLGMIPGSFAVTSHIIVTFALAAFIFISITLIAIAKHGPIKFCKFFLPEGTPWWMAWLIIPIEIMSYLVRPMSLSIRLAANMIAGHITLKVLAMLVITFGIVSTSIVANIFGGTGMFMLLLFITGFEFAIALIQAYIFTLLTCVYLNDALHLH